MGKMIPLNLNDKTCSMIYFSKRQLINSIIFSFLLATGASPSAFCQQVNFIIDPAKKAQTIANFGSSGAWFSEGIGKYWPLRIKEKMAQLLFSKEVDKAGNPLGIGLSAFRFNIGGGSAEQGDSSGITDPVKRVECFLSPDGSYNWKKQEGYLWFMKKAVAYGVKDLIAFSNTPPVQFTKNGLGFKTEKNFETNLKEDKYGAYADFLTTVLQHFDKEGLHFNYISPVNEPQWDWSGSFGKMNQEGCPWHNEDIYKIAISLDSSLAAKKLSAKIIITEAAKLTALYTGTGPANSQLQKLYARDSKMYTGNLSHLLPVVEGHSYFTDYGDSSIVIVRKSMGDSAATYKVPFWQSEYCLLGDGYKEGKKGKVSAIDCALFIAKMIHSDLVIANASAWHWWNSWEPGNADFDTRFYLLALKNNAANTEGDFTITKNLWALGQYSRFITPGMQRIITSRSDGLTDTQAAQDVMLSAYTDGKQIVVVAINYTSLTKAINLQIQGSKKIKSIQQFVTSAAVTDNMKPVPVSAVDNISLQPRSIATFILNMQ